MCVYDVLVLKYAQNVGVREPAGDRVFYNGHLLGHLLAIPKRRNVCPSFRCLCKVLRTVSFPILTKLNESEPENAHNYKRKKVASFS